MIAGVTMEILQTEDRIIKTIKVFRPHRADDTPAALDESG